MVERRTSKNKGLHMEALIESIKKFSEQLYFRKANG